MDRLARTVREQVALGRLLPLGDAGDAAWITESAVVAALRRAAEPLRGVRLGALALELTDPEDAEAAGPGPAAPVGALPYRPIRVTAGFAAALEEPLPRSAERLRAALWATARDWLGVPVASVDLAVTGLLDPAEPVPDAVREGVVVEDGPAPAGEPGAGAADQVAAAALAVPGVLRMTRRLAGLGSGVRVRDAPPAPGAGPTRQVQLQLAVAAGHRPYEVARAVTAAVRSAASEGAPGPVTTAVVVTETT